MIRTGIKNLRPQLPERGKIKLGRLGKEVTSQQGNKFNPPEKLSHFIVTTLARGPDKNLIVDDDIMKLLGSDKPTSIPVKLLYDDPDLNFPTRYASYAGKVLWCSGDGETATRMTADKKGYEPAPEACPCFRQDPAYTGRDKCKPNGSLSVVIRGASGIGGVWKLRTTSYNTVVGILSSMLYIKTITGGPLAGLPLRLVVMPKTTQIPGTDKATTVYIAGLLFDGPDEEALIEQAHTLLLTRERMKLSIETVEIEARRMLSLPPPSGRVFADDDSDEVVEEEYPEQLAGGDAAPPPPTRAPTATAQTRAPTPTQISTPFDDVPDHDYDHETGEVYTPAPTAAATAAPTVAPTTAPAAEQALEGDVAILAHIADETNVNELTTWWNGLDEKYADDQTLYNKYRERRKALIGSR